MDYEFVLSLAANLEEHGATKQAERLYLTVLKEVEEIYGPLSPMAGKVILQLIDFYDREGREVESNDLMKRIHPIADQILKGEP